MLLETPLPILNLDPTSPLAVLLEEFDILVQTPADVDRLDAAILQLAVKGKLVPQDPNDEPASRLLIRMRQEQERLVKLGLIGKPKQVPKITADEIPYTVPAGWQWVRLPEVCHDWGQEKPSRRFTYIDISSIDNKLGAIGDELEVLDPSDAPSRARKIVRVGSVLYSTVRPYLLNIAIVENEHDPTPIASTGFAVMHPFDGLDCTYLFYYLRSNHFVRFVESQMAGMAYPAINDAKLSLGLLPLPPLAEQKRIVASVDELRRHTAALRAELAAAAQGAVTVNNAALARLHSVDNAEEFDAAWQTVVDGFDLFYNVPQTISALRQTILQLAVQGKLVPQDPDDEPASELLRRIEAEKERLHKEGLIGKPAKAEIVRRNVPFSVPELWLWTKFETVADIASNLTDPADHLDFPHIAPNNIEKGTGKLLEYRTVREDDVRSSKHHFYPGQILYSKIRPNLSKVVVIDFEGLCSADMYPIDSYIATRFLHLYMLSETFVSMATNTDTRVAMPKINQTELRKLLFPLPPLAEQERIVAKVDALMALCDVLEADLTATEEARQRLVHALLAGV